MKRLLALALALGTAQLATANDDTAGWGLRPFIGAGYTWGGDTVQRWTYEETSSGNFSHEEDVSAGAGLDLRLGLSYRFGASPVSLQASIAHHIDQTHGVSSRAYFRRMPAELVLLWHANDRVRLGMGVRRSINATFKTSGGTCGNSACLSFREKLKSSTGVILEAEWMMTPNWGLKGRYVFEDYRLKNAPSIVEYEGDHFGVITNYYFN